MNLDDLLRNITIARPCPAQWANMVGDDAKRLCAQCDRHVYNFAEMSRAEIQELIRTKSGKLCGRLYRRVDGTVVTRDCRPAKREVFAAIAKGVAASAMGLSLVAGCVNKAADPTHSPQPTVEQPSSLSPDDHHLIMGDLAVPPEQDSQAPNGGDETIMGRIALPMESDADKDAAEPRDP